ncbi:MULTISPECIES: glycosyltransferase family 1 protein [unclassified Bradyrhizobium]|uniref:glycosyltransferase family 4 protein n=1 Tax=unclassified Bradyrhizobium TaxID=2631580 RepID=UPI00291674A3|nr:MULTISPECIES: glycosyltransferase family 1 protein [unclassified Bradyrhizobium]
MTKVVVATDAWHPQINGVVRTLENLASAASAFGASFRFLTPQNFRTIGLPIYPEIRLSLVGASTAGRLVEAEPFDFVHLATEGPLGLAVRLHCLRGGIPFTTSYHTNFPAYVAKRTRIPPRWTYALLRRFHNAGAATFVATRSIENDLRCRGFERLMLWSRGVDHDQFRQRPGACLGLPGPVFLYVGRLAIEKNLPAFLGLDLPGTKVVVGDGPARRALEVAYPHAIFLGRRSGNDLARVYAGADVFVFPSLTDTFGLVLLEAMSSGLPVAAFPVAGPHDVVGTSGAGVLDQDLRRACLSALEIPRWKARAHAETFRWRESARQFLDNLAASQKEEFRSITD